MKKEKTELKGISRRTFIKGAAAGTVGIATMGIFSACSSSTESEVVEETAKSLNMDWLGEAPVIADSEIVETVTSDVVVIGGGHAGVQCARAAAQLGASVSVVEQQTKDAYTWIGEQVGHFNSQFLIDQGYGPFDVGEVVNEFCKRSGNRINVELIRQYVENSGEMFDDAISVVPADSDLLDNAQGNVHTCYIKDFPRELSGYKTWAGCMQFRGAVSEETAAHGSLSRLPEFERMLVADAESLGATWYFDQSAVVLVQDSNGAVIGVIAQNADGEYTKYIANKGVAICAGDFAGNADMCYALINEVAEFADKYGQEPSSIAGMGRTGMGQKLGVWAGGHLDDAPRASMTMGGVGGPFGLTPFLMLNNDGKRFMNEAIVLGIPAMINRQPLGTVCNVTDSKWLDQVKQCGADHGAPDFGRPEYFEQAQEDMQNVVAAGSEGYAVRSLQFSERQPSTVYGANTLDELATYLGYEGASKVSFLESIDQYNEMCLNSKDTQYGKDTEHMIPINTPPYYGTAGQNGNARVGLVTLVGLITDSNMNVIDDEGNTIDGLYAAGNSLGGRYAIAYATPVAGNSIGMAMTHGRILGKHIASL